MNKRLQKLVLKMPKKIVIVNKERNNLTYEYKLIGMLDEEGPLYSFSINGKYQVGGDIEGLRDLYKDISDCLTWGFELKK